MELALEPKAIITALAYGLIPTVAWLIFWLTADRERPEPKWLIVTAFVSGMVVVLISALLQEGVRRFISDELSIVFTWSLIEEVLKYLAALAIVLRHKEFDEALDALVYMICVALGFAALENTLYALNPLLAEEHLTAASTTTLRFMGATLLHIVASGTVGAAMAFTFYKSRMVRIRAVVIGLAIATGLHTLFNFFIMKLSDSAVYLVFVSIWVLVLGLIAVAEKIKKIDRNKFSSLK